MFFGRTVSLSGSRVLIGSSETVLSMTSRNAAYIFERDSTDGSWAQVARMNADRGFEEGAFASSVALDSTRALITTSGDISGGRYHGAAYLFERDAKTGRWERTARLQPTEDVRFGIMGGSGDLDGDRLAVAASTYFKGEPGSVYIFERDKRTGTWEQKKRLPGIDDFFISLDLDGSRLIVGESREGRKKTGAVTVFERSSAGTWRQATTIRPGDAYDHGAFGSPVALSGDRALVIGFDEQLGLDFNIDRVGFAYKRDPESGRWSLERIVDVGEVHFGSSVALSGPWAFVGQSSDSEAGAAYAVEFPIAAGR